MPQKTNAARASHPSRIVREIFHLAFHRRAADRRLLVRQRSRGVPHLPVLAATGDSENHLCATFAVASGPILLNEQVEEEAATPGQPARARARFRCPPVIHPRELPAATGFTAIVIRQDLEGLTYSLEHTLGQIVAARNRKTLCGCAETVDGRTSLWKAEEILRRFAGMTLSGAKGEAGSRNPERSEGSPGLVSHRGISIT